ncbi:MAG: ATP synthase F0 subunit C [Myxococcota bacterium]|nr:ATP synthase F0 subunit C [Myxococcota bacterium]
MKKTTTTLLTLIALMLVSVPAFADTGLGSVAFSAAMVMGLAALGGTIGQSRAASTALEGIARNPQAAGKVQTPMIIGLAMIESLVLFSFVIAFLIQGNIK